MNGKMRGYVNRHRKLVFIAILISAVLVSSSITYILATFTISRGPYPGAPTYTIFTNGMWYFAKNAYGAIVYSGTNLATVVESAWANGGTIMFSAGDFILTQTLVYNPATAIVATIIGAGGNCPSGGGTNLILKPSSAIPIISVPATAAIYCVLNIEDMNLLLNASGFSTYASPLVDVQAGINNLYWLNVYVGVLSWNTNTAPLSGSIGIRLGSPSNTLSGDMKILDNVWVGSAETGFKIAADWVDLSDCDVYGSNFAAYEFDGQILKPIMDRCHVFIWGNYAIYDNRSTSGFQGYFLTINDFYAECNAPSGYRSQLACYQQSASASGSPFSASNFGVFTAYATPSPQEFNASVGVYLPISQYASIALVIPSSTYTNWNRGYYNTQPTLTNGVVYRNVNMAYMEITLTVQVSYPASGNPIYLAMFQIPPPSNIYSYSYEEANATSPTSGTSSTMELYLQVPPGWWFFYENTNPTYTKIVSYVVTYSDFAV